MRFEISENGKLVLREVTDEAWEYITSEMKRLLTHPNYQHWYFSRERFDGSVYVTATPAEDKTEFMRIMDCLISDFGLEFTQASVHLIRAWRRDDAYAETASQWNAEKDAAEKQIKNLQRLLREGCNGCKHFRVEQIGDDADGYCTAGATPQKLESSLLRFEHGEWDADKKVYHPGRKYYPCSGCKYLNEGERA